MNIILIYLLITLASISIFALVLNKTRHSFLNVQSKRYQLQSDLRSDLFSGWAILNDPQVKDLRGKWFGIAHTIDRRSLHRTEVAPCGRNVLELTYAWLTTRLIMNDLEVHFSFDENFQNATLAPKTQETLLSVISNVLCQNATLTYIQIKYLSSTKRVEVVFKVSDGIVPIVLDEKQRARLGAKDGRIEEGNGHLTLHLPNISKSNMMKFYA